MNFYRLLLILFLLILFFLNILANMIYGINNYEYLTTEINLLKDEAKRFEEQGKYKEALTSLQKILSQKIDDSEKYYINLWMSRILEKAGQNSSNEYIEALRSALHVQKTDTVHYKLGIAYLNAGRISSAKSEFDNALMINPKYFDANFQLGRISLEKDIDCNQAIIYFEAALTISPNQIDALLYLARSYNLRAGEGDINKAISTLERAKNLLPKSYDISISLADMYLKQNNLEKALINYNDALNVTSDLRQRERAQNGVNEINRMRRELESQNDEWKQLEMQFNQAPIMAVQKTETFTKLNKLKEKNPSLTQQLDRLKLSYWNQLMQEGRQKCRSNQFHNAVELFREAEIYAIDENTRSTASNAKSEAMANRELQVDLTQIYQEARNNLDQRPQAAMEQFTALKIVKPGLFIPTTEVTPNLNVAYYNIGKNAYNQHDWFSAVTFLSMLTESDDNKYPNRYQMIENAKRQIPLDYLIYCAKNFINEGKLDSSLWLFKAAFLLNPDDDDIKQLLKQLCSQLGDKASENEDWVTATNIYQFLLKYIDNDDRHARDQLKKAKSNLSLVHILKQWQFWLILLFILIVWPLFWHVRYASNIKRISMLQYIKNSKFIQLRKKINRKHANIIFLLWFAIAIVILIMLISSRRPTTVHLDINSTVLKLHFNKEHTANKSLNLFIQNLSASSIKISGLKELILNGTCISNCYNHLNNYDYINIKSQIQGGLIEIVLRPVAQNISAAKFGFSSGSNLTIRTIDSDRILPLNFKSQNNQIKGYFGSQIDIEISACTIYHKNISIETINAGEIRTIRTICRNENDQMLLTFANNNSSGIFITLIDPDKSIGFVSYDVSNIDFYDELSHESCIIKGKLEYSGIAKPNTEIYKGYSLILDSQSLMLKFIKVTKDFINVKAKAIAKSLKWERDFEEIKKSGIEEIPTYFGWFIKNQTSATTIVILGWFIPVLLAYLELKSRRANAKREPLRSNAKRGKR